MFVLCNEMFCAEIRNIKPNKSCAVCVTRKDDWTMNWKVVENYNLPKKSASSDQFVSSPFEHDKFTVKIYGRKFVFIFPLFLLVSRLTHLIWSMFFAFSIFNPIFDSSIIR